MSSFLILDSSVCQLNGGAGFELALSLRSAEKRRIQAKSENNSLIGRLSGGETGTQALFDGDGFEL
jgi:hypothetical protein